MLWRWQGASLQLVPTSCVTLGLPHQSRHHRDVTWSRWRHRSSQQLLGVTHTLSAECYRLAHKQWNMHALRKSSNRTVSETIMLNHCSEKRSRWRLIWLYRVGMYMHYRHATLAFHMRLVYTVYIKTKNEMFRFILRFHVVITFLYFPIVSL